jgi:hypothetical protein
MMNKILLITCYFQAIVVLVHGGVFGREANNNNSNGTSMYSKSKAPSAIHVVGLKHPIVPKLGLGIVEAPTNTSTNHTSNRTYSIVDPDVNVTNATTVNKQSLVESTPFDMILKPVPQKKSKSTYKKGKGGSSKAKNSKVIPVGTTASGIEVCMQQTADVQAKKNGKMKKFGGTTSTTDSESAAAAAPSPDASLSAVTGIDAHATKKQHRQYRRRIQYKRLPDKTALFIPYTTNSTTNTNTTAAISPTPPQRPLANSTSRPNITVAYNNSSSMQSVNVTTNMTLTTPRTTPVHASTKSSKSKVRDAVIPSTKHITTKANSISSFAPPYVIDTFFSICPPKLPQQEILPYRQNTTAVSNASSNPVPQPTCNVQFASSSRLITDQTTTCHHVYELLLYIGVGLVLPPEEINRRAYTLETTLGTAVATDILNCRQNIPSSNILERTPIYSNSSDDAPIWISKYSLAASDAISVSENCTYLKAEENYTKCIVVHSSSTVFYRHGAAKYNASNHSEYETLNLIIEEAIRKSSAYHCNHGNFTSLGIDQCRSSVLFKSSSATYMNITSAVDSTKSSNSTKTNTTGRGGSSTFDGSLIKAATTSSATITTTTSTATVTNQPSAENASSKRSAIIGATVGALSSIIVVFFLFQLLQKKRHHEPIE